MKVNDFNEFDLIKEKEKTIKGYEWPVENPGHVIVLIHGMGEYGIKYRRMAKEFNRNGYSVYSMDLKGHGRSSGKRGHVGSRKDTIGDIDRLIETAMKKNPGVKIILYGHSMGGNIVLDYRNRGKYSSIITGYIISSPWIKLVKKVPEYKYMLAVAGSLICPSYTVSTGLDDTDKETGKREGRSFSEKYRKNPLAVDRISLQTFVESSRAGKIFYEKSETIRDFKSMKKPVLLFHGTEDNVCMKEGSVRLSQNLGECCTYKEWEGLSHNLYNGVKIAKRDAVMSFMLNWVSGL